MTRMFDGSGTTTATDGPVFATSTLGYGLPVEFDCAEFDWAASAGAALRAPNSARSQAGWSNILV